MNPVFLPAGVLALAIEQVRSRRKHKNEDDGI
jgi:hypothetical protein